MNDIIRIVGSEIWIGTHLFSEGLQGKEWAEKLREAEAIVRACRPGVEKHIKAAVDKAYEDFKYHIEAALDDAEPAAPPTCAAAPLQLTT